MQTARKECPPKRVRKVLIPHLIELLDRHRPDVVLMPNVGKGGTYRSQYIVTVLSAVEREVYRRGLAVHKFTDYETKVALRDGEGRPAKNKAVMNRLIAERFPTLMGSLPKPRRNFDDEPYRQPLFNSVGLYAAWLDLRAQAG
jgi:hypothetical protein